MLHKEGRKSMEYTYISTLLAPWAKSRIVIDDKTIKVEQLKIKGGIQTGVFRKTVNKRNVSGVSITEEVEPSTAVTALICFVVGIALIMSGLPWFKWIVALLVMIMGIVDVLAAYTVTITVELIGSKIYLNFPAFEQKKAKAINKELNECLLRKDNRKYQK